MELSKLFEQIQATLAPVDLDGVSRSGEAHVAIGGKVHRFITRGAARRDVAESVDSFCRMVERYGTENGSVVYVSDAGAVCVLDDAGDRVDRLGYNMNDTPEWNQCGIWATDWPAGGPIDPSDFVAWIQYGANVEVVDQFRHIRFGVEGGTTIIKQPGRESVDRSVTERMDTVAGTLPETVSWSIPPRLEAPFCVDVILHVTPDPAEKVLRVSANPVQMETHRAFVAEWLAKQINAGLETMSGLPVYIGDHGPPALEI